MQPNAFPRGWVLVALLLAVALAPAHAATADAPPARAAAAKPVQVQLAPKVLVSPDAARAMRIPVRNFVGKSVKEAEAGLARDGLKPQATWKKSSRPRGEVVAQEPSQGQVLPGSVVRVEASDGSLVPQAQPQAQPKPQPQPPLQAQPKPQPPVQPQAQAQPKPRPPAQPQAQPQAQWQPQPRAQPQWQPPPPPPQQQPTTVKVPDVLRMDEALARERIAGSGLRTFRGERPSDAVPAGAVLTQDPQPGVEVQRGTPVYIMVATPIPMVWVPGFVGQQEDAALAGLRGIDDTGTAVKVHTVVQHSSAPARRVLKQQPMNARVPRGTLVTLHVSDASLVRVPEVRRAEEAEAVDRLRKAGLRAMPEPQPTDQHPVGSVFEQSPPAGREVRRDSQVTITVAAAIPPPAVPPGPVATGPTPPGPGTPPATASPTSPPPGAGTTVGPVPPTPPSGPGWFARFAADPPWEWLFAAVALAALGLARSLGRRPPKTELPPPPAKPTVHVQWCGPAERATLSAPEGGPERLSLRVSAVRASERPLAVLPQAQEEVSHA